MSGSDLLFLILVLGAPATSLCHIWFSQPEENSNLLALYLKRRAAEERQKIAAMEGKSEHEDSK